MISQLGELQASALDALNRATDAGGLEAWRVSYLGRKGALTVAMSRLGALPAGERPAAGQAANEVKMALESAWNARRAALDRATLDAALESERLDVTLPGRTVRRGGKHVITQIIDEVCGVFATMGFQVVEGPEVEWDRYNFTLLNIPPDHPARDLQDTFHILGWEGRMVLRTHTSPNQARVMERVRPPVRVVVPGLVYRCEATDAIHESQFHQIEGLAVDTSVTMADLKGTLTTFARALFGGDRRVRFRCDYFPFVEPGVDLSIDCFMCNGKGCRLCKDTGWIEIMGAGMVHPTVLANVGYDPAVYTGFAFGMGPERIAMLKYGIEDIRHFHGNDPRFLRQFA
jgi:phenylalanyl-tRNA synthetase alpha chain